MGFTREQLQSYRDHTVDPIIPDDLRLLFVGINPGLWTAATNTPFAHPGNRFYPALRLAGIIERDISPSAGMTPDDRAHLRDRGIGMTNIVARATARADELTGEEYLAGGLRLLSFVEKQRPAVVAIAGITAYRKAFRRPQAKAGEQREQMVGARLFVVPNPSGLNAHATVQTLAVAYREAAVAAGIVGDPQS